MTPAFWSIKGRGYLLRSNRNKEAADKLAQAAQIAPNLAEAHLNYGLARETSKTDDALSEFKLALNLNPSLNSAWLTMGALYQSTGQLPTPLPHTRNFSHVFPRTKTPAR